MGCSQSYEICEQTENCLGINDDKSINILENILKECKQKQILLFLNKI